MDCRDPGKPVHTRQSYKTYDTDETLRNKMTKGNTDVHKAFLPVWLQFEPSGLNDEINSTCEFWLYVPDDFIRSGIVVLV
jgi:hypothetical protein